MIVLKSYLFSLKFIEFCLVLTSKSFYIKLLNLYALTARTAATTVVVVPTKYVELTN